MSRRGRPRVVVAAVLILVSAVALAVVASGLYRHAYGAWFPAAPDRVEVCGRRYYRHGGSAPTVLEATGGGPEARSIGRRPPVVGTEFFAVSRRSGSCPPGSVVRRARNGRFETYGLSGSL